MTKRALITGITGQDGSYLTELLLDKGYEVHGLIRRASSFNTNRIDHVFTDPHDPNARLFLHHGDMLDGSGIQYLLEKVQPDEIYNLAAQSHVKVSFEQPEYTLDVVAAGTLKLLQALRSYQKTRTDPVRFYQAGSSEMYGSVPPPQNEETVFEPRSPYAISKLAAHHFCKDYRDAYDLHISNGILFNHESPRRGETFVTRKITRAIGRILAGTQKKLYLGNLDARRDWGFAGDYVEAMWMMLQQETPDDYVVATGEGHSVREFLDEAFRHAGLSWEDYVEIDPRYFRPTEVDNLCGDASKARRVLGWKPGVSFTELAHLMVDADVALAEREKAGSAGPVVLPPAGKPRP